MPFDSAVTATPIGASRTLDWYMNLNGSGLTQANARSALAQNFNLTASSSNSAYDGSGMVLTNPYQLAPVQVGGKWLRMCKLQGTYWFTTTIPLTTTRPTAKDIGYPLGRYIWEGLFYWTAPTGSPQVDSGLLLSTAGNARTLGTSLDPGIGLGNRNGVLTFYSRGPGGFEAVDVSAYAGPLNSLNKLTLIVRQPGLGRDASVTALVNDIAAVTRSWGAGHRLPVPISSAAHFYPQLPHTTTAADCWVDQLRYSAGPDIPDL